MPQPRLFTPLTLRGLEVRNRLWVAPMCQYAVLAEDGVATDWHLVHLGGFAKGGVGAILVEATAVVPEGRISARDLGLWNDAQRDALARIADFAHEQGAAIGIQLAHAGRKASVVPEWGVPGRGTVGIEQGGWQSVAPSAVAFDGYLDPRELSLDELAGIVAAFVAAARRALEAGLDFVEIHAAHGYLLHEFLSPLSNRRADAYGGSLENRARLLIEIVDAVRAEIGEAVPLLARFSATDWHDDGWSLADTEQVVAWVAEHGVDLVDISSGGLVAGVRIPTGPGYQVPFAASVRAATQVPTAAVGMIDTPFQAEQVLVTGQADVVMVGRQLLREPSFALRAARELGAELDYRPGPYLRAFA